MGISLRNRAHVKRVIHTSADFDYAQTSVFFRGRTGACDSDALKDGASIVTDTQMA